MLQISNDRLGCLAPWENQGESQVNDIATDGALEDLKAKVIG